MEAGRSFDTVAALYDAQRSGYPEKLFEDISALAALGEGTVCWRWDADRGRLQRDLLLGDLILLRSTPDHRSSISRAKSLRIRRRSNSWSHRLRNGARAGRRFSSSPRRNP